MAAKREQLDEIRVLYSPEASAAIKELYKFGMEVEYRGEEIIATPARSYRVWRHANSGLVEVTDRQERRWAELTTGPKPGTLRLITYAAAHDGRAVSNDVFPGDASPPTPVDPEAVVALLESMLAADPAATHALLINRVPCNAALVDHPAVVVDGLARDGGRPVVGLLGVLNGLCYAGGRVVAMKISDDRELVGFTIVDTESLPPEAAGGDQ